MNPADSIEQSATTAIIEVSGQATAAAFPLGGIGTGNVWVGSRGELRDWEIANSPGKGNKLPYSFFAIRAARSGAEPVSRVLEAALVGPHESSHGYYPGDVAGLPRLASSTMRGSYPFVEISFVDESLPVTVRMEAFTPFVPLDSEASGIPGAVIRYQVMNEADTPCHVTVAGSMANPVGISDYELFFFPLFEGNPRNAYRESPTARGIYFTSDLPHDCLRTGSMALVTAATELTHKAEWLDGYWWDGIQDFWDEFTRSGSLSARSQDAGAVGPLSEKSRLRVGSLALSAYIPPGGSHTFEFVLAWHFPNRPHGWLGHIAPENDTDAATIVRNNYTRRYDNAWQVAEGLLAELPALEDATRRFSAAIEASTLPTPVLQSILVGIVVLRSTTCFWLEDGTFLGWEGTFDRAGSCEGNCTHVWNYAQTAAYLFPDLERSMRRTEFLLETDELGAMAFRTYRALGGVRWEMLPAVDGQLGCVVRLFRDWMFSGDDEFLKELWPGARRALDYALRFWDSDGDGVLDSEQHNTYDIQFHGPNSLTNSVFFAALAAAAQIARYLGDHDAAEQYEEARKKGSATMDDMLWDGAYYIQQLPDIDLYRYQYGTGCLSDQLFGQFLAHVVGLGYVLPESHVKQATAAVFANNFITMRNHHSVQRTYALNDEKGLVLCSWPRGGRPRLPFVYSDEVWVGIEYQVAAQLIYDGSVTPGIELVSAVRARHDGFNRNPWNEVECGNHYVRSMASWALLLALSGCRYEAPFLSISFDPKVSATNFRTFFTAGRAWGTYSQRSSAKAWHAALSLDQGQLALGLITLRPNDHVDLGSMRIRVDGSVVTARAEPTSDAMIRIHFDSPVMISHSLQVELTSM